MTAEETILLNRVRAAVMRACKEAQSYARARTEEDRVRYAAGMSTCIDEATEALAALAAPKGA